MPDDKSNESKKNQKKKHDDLRTMNNILVDKNAKWVAGITPHWSLSNDELKKKLGAKKPKPKPEVPHKGKMALPADWFVKEPYEVRDWRGYYQDQGVRHRTQNYVTSIKDQHTCPACAAFAIVASMEANFQIQLEDKGFPGYPTNDPEVVRWRTTLGDELDLSEWYLFIHGFEHSETICSTDATTWPDPEDGLKKVSEPDGIAIPWEYILRYPWPDPVWYANLQPNLEPLPESVIDSLDYSGTMDVEPAFSRADLFKKVSLKIMKQPLGLTSFEVTEHYVKNWLSHVGPVVSVMKVYGDFMRAYAGGVYHRELWQTGDQMLDEMMNVDLGYHAICIVGYSDIDECWICKNSWGTRWGDAGWFYIKYDECDIGTADCRFFTTAIRDADVDQFMKLAYGGTKGFAEELISGVVPRPRPPRD